MNFSMENLECTADYGQDTEINQTLHVARRNTSNCSVINLDDLKNLLRQGNVFSTVTSAQLFFTYFTPVIFTIGMIGNCLSLAVFLSKNMRKLSGSQYLAALSISDLMVLIFYVFTEWIKRGLPVLTGQVSASFLAHNGTCQILLYFQYISRFLSSWLLACFTVERYIGVCHPLKRRDICDPRASRRIILGMVVIGSIYCVYKPILSGVYEVGPNRVPICTGNPEYANTSYFLDSTFAAIITIFPFIILSILNIFIIRKLFIRNKHYRKIKIVTEESIIRLEFTIILLAISICFVTLNLPFFSVWCKIYWTYHNDLEDGSLAGGESHHLGDALFITRTIFYVNYCINFFLYSVTGAYFRNELRHLFLKKEKYNKHDRRYSANSRSNTHTTPQSWV
ncbi:hypothetical protein ACJMK2_004612 [Sinanodonta woodiana]|uniref:G-protein coupled receptors family 1 profile domain-containing protein n=1 Tax=Sinanodonta woodiana TaxID=1069815 RepID=A0ABD3Y3I4_SINWO